MLYIEIPEGMEYQTIPKVDSNGNAILDDHGNATHEDFFVSKDGKGAKICIQDAVRTLHLEPKLYKRENQTVEINGLVIHKTKPGCGLKVLKYRSNRSGLAPTDCAEILDVPQHIKSHAPSGSRWINDTFLGKKAAQKAREKELAQKENRRKTGDSPKAN